MFLGQLALAINIHRAIQKERVIGNRRMSKTFVCLVYTSPNTYLLERSNFLVAALASFLELRREVEENSERSHPAYYGMCLVLVPGTDVVHNTVTSSWFHCSSQK